jgi:hypothetical protein
MTSQAIKARDAGIAQAIQHAEEIHLGWTDKAVEAIRTYARCVRARGETFTAEKVRNSIIGACVPAPPHKRAWGGAILRAQREGIIVKAGITHSKAAHCHLSMVTEWRAS